MKFQTPKIAAILKASRLFGCAGVLVGIAALLIPASHANEPLSSESYRLDPNITNSFGGLVTSDSYELLDSGGEAVIGLGDSPSYKLSQGYVSQLEQAIELSVLPAGLVGYWPLNTGTGIQAYDVTANGNHGVLENDPQWVSGKVGSGAVEFDRSNGDYISVNNGLNLTDGTLSAWVKSPTSSTSGQYNGVVSKTSSGAASNITWYLDWNNNDNLRGGIGDGSSAESVSGLWNPTPNQWHHVVFTFNGENLVLYVDGQEFDKSPQSLTPQQSSHPVRIGTTFNTTHSWNGAIDEVKVYNRALSADEVLDEYNASASGLPSALTLPRLDPSQSQSVDANAIVQTDAGGYHIAVEQDGDLRTTQGNAISAIESSITFPSQWNEGTTTGFGFTVTGAVQRDGKWGNSPNFEYAAVPNTSTTFHSRSGLSGGFKETTALRFRAGVDSVQAGGIYSNRLGFTATLKP